MIEPRDSMAQNIDRLCFAEGAPLRGEFEELYHAVFSNAESYIDVVRLLGQHRHGLTMSEMRKALKLKSGATLSRIVDNLVKCNFIGKRAVFGRKSEVYIV